MKEGKKQYGYLKVSATFSYFRHAMACLYIILLAGSNMFAARSRYYKIMLIADCRCIAMRLYNNDHATSTGNPSAGSGQALRLRLGQGLVGYPVRWKPKGLRYIYLRA
jgi:hypothetical protein